MYEVKFEYTRKIVNYIAEISSTRETILNAQIIPKYDLLLKNNAIIQSSHNSTSIEGNPLSINEVKKLFEGEKLAVPEKSKKEVLNYFNVLKNLDKHCNNYITEETILNIHKDISKDILKRKECEGRYRETPMIIGDLKNRKINFTPPAHYKVPYLIKEFLEWLNNNRDIYPVLLAGIAHYELVRIHPFIDGNGRTARALATLILSLEKFDIKRYFALDEFYNNDRASYVNALKSADKSQDLTEWLEYFCYGVLNSINKVKEEIKELSKLELESIIKIELTEQEIKILNFIKTNKRAKNKDIRELLNISSQATFNHLQKLKEKNLIKSKGSGRSTEYVLKK